VTAIAITLVDAETWYSMDDFRFPCSGSAFDVAGDEHRGYIDDLTCRPTAWF
jgi:hypothetical protein